MSEPTRKKEKASIRPVLEAVHTNQPHSFSTEKVNEFSFWTCHQKKPAYVDLSLLATGYMPELFRGKGSKGKKFTGRPEFLRQLMPYIRLAWFGYSESTADQNMRSLRKWWQILDQAEAANSNGNAPLKRVIGVEDLNELHAAIARMENIQPIVHYNFTRLVNLCLKDLGKNPLFWPAPAFIGKNASLPEYWEMEKIRHQLKRNWFSAIDRWERADILAKKEDTSLQAAISSGNPHACFRHLSDALGDPNPAAATIWNLIGALDKSKRPWEHRECVFGRYPSGNDVKSAFHLFLLASGWNVQTALDLDVTSKFVEAHPTNDGYHIVWGLKNRGNSMHFVIGRDKRSDSPGSILRRLVERTRPLRVKLHRELLAVEDALAQDPSNTDLLLRQADLRKAVKSPWLFVNGSSSKTVAYLTNSSVGQSSTGLTFLGELIRQLNKTLPTNTQVSEKITAGDFRDAYIGFAYEFSNYNILTAQIAATHKSVRSTQHYLRQHQWRAHSAKKIHIFTHALWQEIATRKVVDPAILRGLVERGEVSEEQRIRWERHKDRTRVGVGCKDFKNPPSNIAPRHVDGSGCRVQRCTLCEHAIVFDDSVDHLCRRMAELEKLRSTMAVPSWSASSFPDEVDATEAILRKFAQQDVKASISYWKSRINSGAHRVPDMEGSYE